jgi:hypothetical protein
MIRIRATLLFAVFGVLPSFLILALTGATLVGPLPVYGDDRVLNAPYSAQRRFTSVEKLADGTINRSESGGSKARDSQGRTYSADERHWTYLEGNKSVLKSEMLYEIEDPVAHTGTRWDSTSKVVKVIHYLLQHSPEKEASGAQGVKAMLSAFGAVVQKIGMKTIGGFVAEGTRSSLRVPAGQEHNDQPIVVVHESWYCPELKIVILETDDDPRSGGYRDESVDIVRGEPDVTKYHPPADYAVHQVQLPW